MVIMSDELNEGRQADAFCKIDFTFVHVKKSDAQANEKKRYLNLLMYTRVIVTEGSLLMARYAKTGI